MNPLPLSQIDYLFFRLPIEGGGLDSEGVERYLASPSPVPTAFIDWRRQYAERGQGEGTTDLE